MARTLTPRQKGFAKDYLTTGNATQAVEENYNVKNAETAASMGSELLRIPKVRKYIEDKSERAAEIIYDLAENSKNDTVRLSASKDILDRANVKVADEIIVKSANMTYSFIFNSQTQAEIKEMEAKIKAHLIEPNVQTNQESI